MVKSRFVVSRCCCKEPDVGVDCPVHDCSGFTLNPSVGPYHSTMTLNCHVSFGCSFPYDPGFDYSTLSVQEQIFHEYISLEIVRFEKTNPAGVLELAVAEFGTDVGAFPMSLTGTFVGDVLEEWKVDVVNGPPSQIVTLPVKMSIERIYRRVEGTCEDTTEQIYRIDDVEYHTTSSQGVRGARCYAVPRQFYQAIPTFGIDVQALVEYKYEQTLSATPPP